MLSISTPQDIFTLYMQVIARLGYPQEFSTEEIQQGSLSIDQLSGFIAQTDSELDYTGFSDECNRIDHVIESLGYEI